MECPSNRYDSDPICSENIDWNCLFNFITFLFFLPQERGGVEMKTVSKQLYLNNKQCIFLNIDSYHPQ